MIDFRVRRFDSLEARKLLTAAHVASAVPETPIALTGTLDVELSKASTVVNVDGSATTQVPVEGRLGTLDRITGVWSHTIDSYGDYEGPDTLVLQANHSKGAFTISFDDNDAGMTAKPLGHGVNDYQHGQKITGGSGVFAKVSERGSIELMLNTNKEAYQSLVLITVPTATSPVA